MYVYTDIVDTGHHHKYKYTSLKERFKMSKAQTLIEQFYQEEIARKAEEATFTPLEITVSSADMALISTISKRFSKDKSVLVREAVSQALLDMFSALEPIERKILAKDADELAKGIAAEIAEEQSIDGLEVSGINWVQQDKNCIKEERKAEKEKAMQQAQAAKAVLNNQSNSSSADEPQPEMTEQAHTAELDDDEDLLADTTDESNDELVTESEDEIKAEESEKERSIFG
ncbi:MAG: hypothetical protein ACI843_000689 [Psychrobacter glaciei]|jgi:hypothetical protein